MSCERSSPSFISKGDFHCSLLVEPVLHPSSIICHQSGISEPSKDPLEVELQLNPTVQLRNGLPYPMVVTLKEVGGEEASPSTTAVGRELRSWMTRLSSSPQLLEEHFGDRTAKGSKSLSSLYNDVLLHRVLLPPGTMADVFVDLRKDIMAFCEVPNLGLQNGKWFMIHKSSKYMSQPIRVKGKVNPDPPSPSPPPPLPPPASKHMHRPLPPAATPLRSTPLCAESDARCIFRR